jgi:hypothetical protein
MKVTMSAARYELLADLGEGAQGRVVRVRDRERGAVVALKAVPPGARATLVREFARLASLDHPSLPRAYDLGTLAADLGPSPPARRTTPPGGSRAGRSPPAAPLDAIGVWVVAIDVAAALVALHARPRPLRRQPRQRHDRRRGAARRAVLLDLRLAGSAGLDNGARDADLPPEALTGRAPAGDLSRPGRLPGVRGARRGAVRAAARRCGRRSRAAAGLDRRRGARAGGPDRRAARARSVPAARVARAVFEARPGSLARRCRSRCRIARRRRGGRCWPAPTPAQPRAALAAIARRVGRPAPAWPARRWCTRRPAPAPARWPRRPP